MKKLILIGLLFQLYGIALIHAQNEQISKKL